ncbi:MAG: methylmalonyl Co-A mutase-associated GTPase MeaB, partial [Terriglobia bacterium]
MNFELSTLHDWAAQVRAGNRLAIARAITAVESGGESSLALLRVLFQAGRRAEIIGVTGAPGVGKSTLVDKLARLYRGEGLRLGILSVDPSSPFSGGALLGDRIRMQSLSADPEVYIRSMATRGNLGGLSAATQDAVTVLEAAGCAVVLVETVGVGQDEVEVAGLADITLLLLAPGAGDSVQALKAGVMEIADVLVINKADYPGATRAEQEIAAVLSLRPDAGEWKPPIVKTVASTGEGVQDVRRKIEDFRAFGEANGLQERREREKCRSRLLALTRQRLFEKFVRPRLADPRLDQAVDRVLRREQDPH